MAVIVADAGGGFCHLVHRVGRVEPFRSAALASYGLPAFQAVSAPSIVIGRVTQAGVGRAIRNRSKLETFYPVNLRLKSETPVQGLVSRGSMAQASDPSRGSLHNKCGLQPGFCPTGKSASLNQKLFKPCRQNILLPFFGKYYCLRASRLRWRGVSRSSRTLGAGMRWTLGLSALRRSDEWAWSGRRSRLVLILRR